MDTIKRKCGIKSLPAKNSMIGLNHGQLIYAQGFGSNFTFTKNVIPQHLYILSDDEIKEGDLFYNSDFDQTGIFICERNDPREYFTSTKIGKSGYKHRKQYCKKVIASTDKLLNLPGISQSFIKKYCEIGGIDEVMVEYAKKCETCGAEQYHDICHYPNATGCCGGKCNPIPQLNSKKELILSKAKNTWTKSEVIHLLKQSCKDLWFEDSDSYKDLDKWIKENL